MQQKIARRKKHAQYIRQFGWRTHLQNAFCFLAFLEPEKLQYETSSFQFRSLCCIGRLMSMEYSKLVRGVAHLLFSSSTLIISLSAIANSPVCYNQRAQVNKNNKWGNNRNLRTTLPARVICLYSRRFIQQNKRHGPISV